MIISNCTPTLDYQKGGFFLSFWLEFGKAWLQPMPWLSLFFPGCQIIYYAIQEKAVSGERIHSPMSLFVKTCFWGLMMGILFSLSSILFRVNLNRDEVVLVWLFVLLIACFGFRFLCFSHIVGCISLIQLMVKQIDLLREGFQSHPIGVLLLHFSLVDWLWIIVFLHIGEWLLIRFNGLEGRQIITAFHQDGYQVNGYCLSRIWPIPTVFFTPFGWLPVPLITGFSSYNLSIPIHQQKRLASTYALLHAALLAIGLSIASVSPLGLWFASIWAFVGHELFFQYQKWKEKRLPPLFTSDHLGLKVLEVVPASPAAQLGIRPGYILQKANGVSIHTIQDLEKVTKQSAHCKLKLLDGQLDHHFVQKVIYEDDPKHLGIIGAIPLNEIAAAKEDEHEANE